MSRSPVFASPLVADPVSFSALDLDPGAPQVGSVGVLAHVGIGGVSMNGSGQGLGLDAGAPQVGSVDVGVERFL